MLEGLQDLPRFSSLKNFMNRLLSQKGEATLSVILFGSMARKDYTKYSDYDLLIIVDAEKRRFIDRIYDYSLLSDGWIEPFIYTKDEVESMFQNLHPLLLDALKDGVPLFDKGFWLELKSRFDRLLKEGTITPKRWGWDIIVSP